jgi:hypothetical protein
MTAIANRLTNLETKIGATNSPGRVIAVGSNGANDEEINRFLAENGIVVDHRGDLVVHLNTVFLDGDDRPRVGPLNIRLVNVTEIRKH